ncbi:hypothetical protein ACLM5H_09460 [Fredinandcohnia humi]
MIKQNTIGRVYNQSEENTKNSLLLEFIDGEQFDKLLGKVTRGLFSLIVFVGIPYFIYVLWQFLLMN